MLSGLDEGKPRVRPGGASAGDFSHRLGKKLAQVFDPAQIKEDLCKTGRQLCVPVGIGIVYWQQAAQQQLSIHQVRVPEAYSVACMTRR